MRVTGVAIPSTSGLGDEDKIKAASLFDHGKAGLADTYDDLGDAIRFAQFWFIQLTAFNDCNKLVTSKEPSLKTTTRLSFANLRSDFTEKLWIPLIYPTKPMDITVGATALRDRRMRNGRAPTSPTARPGLRNPLQHNEGDLPAWNLCAPRWRQLRRTRRIRIGWWFDPTACSAAF